jgi:hypothetical protein
MIPMCESPSQAPAAARSRAARTGWPLLSLLTWRLHRQLRPAHGLGHRHPAPGLGRGIGAALLIGALAGLLPAIRAARLSPTQALWKS